MTNALVPHIAGPVTAPDPWACLYEAEAFGQLERLAKAISQAGLVPQHLRGQTADIVLALGMARAMRENPVLVLQSIYVINGRACWSAQYIIARANASGRFRGPINWTETGEGDSLVVTAYATVAETGERIESVVSMAMAKAEGWAGKNKKYQSMPIVMLRYRSATLLARQFCPDVLMGLHERYELIDVYGEGQRPQPVQSVTYTDLEPASQAPRVSLVAPQLATRGVGEPSVSAGSSPSSPGPEGGSVSSTPTAATSPGPDDSPSNDPSWTPSVEARFVEQLLKLDASFTLEAISAFCETASVPTPCQRTETQRRNLLDALRGGKREAAVAFCREHTQSEPEEVTP